MAHVQAKPWNPSIVALLISVGVTAGVVALRATGAFERTELKAYDLWCNLRPADTRAAGSIVIVGITEQDIQRLKQYPISDENLAHAIEKLLVYEPQVIGLDIFRDIEVGTGRTQLDNLLTRERNIVVPFMFGQQGYSVAPPPVMRDSDRTGFTDQVLDSDGIVR